MKPAFFFCLGCRSYYLIDGDLVEPGTGIMLKDIETAYGPGGWKQGPHKSCGCNRFYVRIDINEGLPRIVECPDNVDVEIRDYDVEGGVADEAALLTDEDGAQYLLVG